MKQRLKALGFALAGIVAFVVIGMVLDRCFGFPIDMSYRIACASMCLGLLAKMALESHGDRWLWIALWVAIPVNACLFLTPLVDHPASRGDVLFFALPDTVIVLAVRAWTYPVDDAHARAVRQQLVLGLALAAIFCALFLSLLFVPDHRPR